MSHEELQSFLERFNEIKNGSGQLRIGRLEILRNDLRQTYNIPRVHDVEFGLFSRMNPEVATLFKAVVNEIGEVLMRGAK